MYRKLILQAMLYAPAAAALAYFSSQPPYTHQDPSLALVKVSFSHAGVRKEDCRRLTPEEIAALPPNMRRTESCSRERVPLLLEMEVDGSLLVQAELPPSGLAGDGAASIYRRLPVAAGSHEFVARLRDSRRGQGFDFEKGARIELPPRQVLAIDFQPDAGGFLFMAGAMRPGPP